MQININSASKHDEPLAETSASVFVITQDDIRRSGVTSIPEALRLAPSIEVARIGSHEWAISIRGFNSDIANKLLVLIDGRSVYSPLYAGVFWDVQDTLLEDIDRIEVISGPGGTLWGANAVNGVINIITRSSQKTQGGFTEIGGGNEEKGFSGFRYGGKSQNNIAMRGYLKYFNRDASAGHHTAVIDDWDMRQGGFRMDWESGSSDNFTVQGDIYSGKESGLFQGNFTLGTMPLTNIEDENTLEGSNLLGRWNRKINNDSDFTLQIYYDHTERDIPYIYDETRDTFDIDFHHHVNANHRHEVVWGGGYRLTRDEIKNSSFSAFNPDHQQDETFSAFLQDKIALVEEKFFLTLGSKIEHNDYSRFESQPNIRATWLLSDRQILWSAISKAVRIPSRLDTDLQLTIPLGVVGIPFYVTVDGNPDFKAEKLLAYEAGYRFQVTDSLSFDVAVFQNYYDDIQTAESGAPIVPFPPTYAILPKTMANGIDGESYGGTIVMDWKPTPDWRWRFQYALLDLQLDNKTGSNDIDSKQEEGNSPKHQFAIHTFADIKHNVSFYAGLRYVDDLPNQDIDAYIALNVNLSWRMWESLELSLTGQNLNDPVHAEFNGAAQQEIERSIHGKVAYRF